MGLFNVVNRASMAAGQPEDVSVILANLDAIAAVLNGGIDNSNINAAAGILASKLAGYPADGTKTLKGDGTWGSGGSTITRSLISGGPPGAPVDGDIWIAVDSLAAPTYIWVLKYNAAAATNKWEYQGGVPQFAEVTAQEGTASVSYAAVATAGPSLTVVRAGDYFVRLGSSTQIPGNIACWHSYDIGGSGAVDADALHTQAAAASSGFASSRARLKTLAAATALVSKYKTSSGTPLWEHRTMEIIPRAIA